MNRREEAEERGYDPYDDTLGYAGQGRIPVSPAIKDAVARASAAAAKARASTLSLDELNERIASRSAEFNAGHQNT